MCSTGAGAWSTNSGVGGLDAHLIGSQTVTHYDLTPSAVLCVVFFLLAIGAVYRYVSHVGARFAALLEVAVAMLFTGIAFSIRAAIANTTAAGVNRLTIIAEQIFFVAGQLLLIEAHITLSRDLVNKSSFFHWPSTFAFLSRLILVVSFILSTIAFTRLPYDPTSLCPSTQYTQMRIAGATFPLLLVFVNTILLPMEKVKHSEIPMAALGVLIVIAWFLVPASFYAFLTTTVADDNSPLIASKLWFYLAFGLFQILAVAPLLAIPLGMFFVPAPWFMGLRGAQVAQDIEDQIHEELHDELHDEERQLMR